MKRITIDPITRLEGHGKIEIFLNDNGEVDKAFLQIPELRGFEKFCEGRPAEEMPRITPKICGVCPTAHHMAATKALDDLYKVKPTPAAKAIRELMYNSFIFEDHMLHFFFLGAPEFIVGLNAPKNERNILGVIEKVGLEVGKQVIEARKRARNLISLIGGRVIHPVCGLPGGVSKPLSDENRIEAKETANYVLEFAKFAISYFKESVLSNREYVDLIKGDVYKHSTYYMGLVDEDNKINFYDGKIRVVTPDGEEFKKFDVKEFQDNIEEHVEPWSYITFPYLKEVGWKGFVDGKESGVFRVAPLARLNASNGMPTPIAQEEYEYFYETMGGKPVHNTLAFHWARLIEALSAAELMVSLSNAPELTDPNVRNIPTEKPTEGFGVVEAPRGTLIHYYKTDDRGLIQEANLIVATVNNAAAINMSIEKAAKGLIKGDKVSDSLLNMVEMGFRAYDPCFACATHTLPGQLPLEIRILDSKSNLIRSVSR